MGLVLEELTGKIIGAAIEVHRQSGPGFIESIYKKALVHELGKRGWWVEEQLEVLIIYDRRIEAGRHRPDLFVEGPVEVDLKTVTEFADVHFSVVRSPLRAVNRKHGLLVNFAKLKLDVKRVICES